MVAEARRFLSTAVALQRIRALPLLSTLLLLKDLLRIRQSQSLILRISRTILIHVAVLERGEGVFIRAAAGS